MAYIEVWVDDVDVDSIVSEYGPEDWRDFLTTHRDPISVAMASTELGALKVALEDPIKRLELIEALRAQGYAVEPS